MTLITEMLVMKAIYWERKDGVDRGGRYSYHDAVEVMCWWTDHSEQYTTSDRKMVISRSMVYVDRPMKVGDALKRGPLDDLTDSGIETNDPERFGGDEVRVQQTHPDWNDEERMYVVIL